MLPSGFGSVASEDVRVREIGKGLYVVEDAYEGDYDFFSPSQLYSTPKQTGSLDQATTSVNSNRK